MSDSLGFSIPFARRLSGPEPTVSYVLKQRTLGRILNFTGHTIDDVVNDPIVKNKIIGYYKLHHLIRRRGEIVDLERQWNSVG